MSQAVDALRTQTLSPEQVIVVIDDNEELLQQARAELPVELVIANRHPGGASGGRLTGAEEASAPILVFLDDDAVPEPKWLEELLAPLADEKALGVGGALVPRWQTERMRWLAPEMYWTIGCTWAGASEKDGRIRSPIAASMAIRADVFNALDGLNPELGRSDRAGNISGTAEETEFCLRAAAQHPGHYFLFSPGSVAHHLVPAQRTTWRYFVGRCRLEGDAKAILTDSIGMRVGLAKELRYTLALPKAVVRDLVVGLRGDPDGVKRAGATFVGFSITAVAYARTRLRRSLRAG